ncbi:MAG TPA: single-stranded-DNA-specific exonuclease RecJ [bacterium]|nr:single-stranded-DNA-specific exonuclease RecJ [bacterium]HNS49083.1 single-stranded-DNA-specific exonuclease RecJ [bacterium]
MDNKIWEFVFQDENLKAKLAEELNISPFLASCLINRGITDSRKGRAFLWPELRSLANPMELPGMEAAVERLKTAVRNREKILVYGDYDADGVTATALLSLFLRGTGLEVETYLPHRVEEGYGLHFAPLRAARKRGVTLVVTVDCGSSAAETVRKAVGLGLDIIVTDHHLPGEEVPAEIPVVNPQLGGQDEFRGLSGVGVAFELARALAMALDPADPAGQTEALAEEYLDLVAAGSIADLSPLQGESRILTWFGLRQLRGGRRPAFSQLCAGAGIRPETIGAQSVGYIIGPRLNAAGRLDSADLALKLFTTSDPEECRLIAAALNDNNRKRQQLERRIFNEATRAIEDAGLNRQPVLVLAGCDWHLGVVGIVAGKLAERYGKPAIVLSVSSGQAKGSGRSVSGFNLFEAIQSCQDLLKRYGGHQKAVGLTLETEKLADFTERLNRNSAPLLRTTVQSRVKIELTAELEDLTPEFMRELETLEPFGVENPEPVLATMGLEVQNFSRLVGNNRHLKLWLKRGSVYREAIGFGLGELYPLLPAGVIVDAAYTPRFSDREGVPRISLELKSLRRESSV